MIRCLLAVLLLAGCTYQHSFEKLEGEYACIAECDWCVNFEIWCVDDLEADHPDRESILEAPGTDPARLLK